MPKELAHFDASRLKMKPMAIGRIPSDFLFSAKRRPPKKTGAITERQPPVLSWRFLVSISFRAE